MKLIQLINADSCTLDWRGQRYSFAKGVPVEVPHELADRLLHGGQFMHIVSLDQAPAVKPLPSGPVTPAAPVATKGKKK